MDQMYKATEISEVKQGTALFLFIVSIIGSEFKKNCTRYCKYACLYLAPDAWFPLLLAPGTRTFEVHSPTPAAGVETSLHT